MIPTHDDTLRETVAEALYRSVLFVYSDMEDQLSEPVEEEKALLLIQADATLAVAIPIIEAPLRSEIDRLREALTRLVAAKDEKERNGDTPTYRDMKYAAWADARQALASEESDALRVELAARPKPGMGDQLDRLGIAAVPEHLRRRL